MKNVFYQKNGTELIKRINELNIDSKALWGKMNVNQMICHVADQIRMAAGVIKTDFIGNKLQETILKRLILLGMPIPRGKVPTTKELNQEKLGTQPVGFEEDRKSLIILIKEFDETYPENARIRHPAFSAMTKKQWARLVYLHLDHHLRQFGK